MCSSLGDVLSSVDTSFRATFSSFVDSGLEEKPAMFLWRPRSRGLSVSSSPISLSYQGVKLIWYVWSEILLILMCYVC